MALEADRDLPLPRVLTRPDARAFFDEQARQLVGLIGSFDTIDEALAEDARRFGLSSFLVRRVEEPPPVIEIPP